MSIERHISVEVGEDSKELKDCLFLWDQVSQAADKIKARVEGQIGLAENRQTLAKKFDNLIKAGDTEGAERIVAEIMQTFAQAFQDLQTFENKRKDLNDIEAANLAHRIGQDSTEGQSTLSWFLERSLSASEGLKQAVYTAAQQKNS